MRRIADECLGERGGVLVDLLVGMEVQRFVVVDAEAAAGVDVADVVAVFSQVGDEADDACGGGGEGFDVADL